MKFRKKPVVIDAVTWYGKYTDETEWPYWFRTAIEDGTITILNRSLLIATLEGSLRGEIGDKIVQGVKGEIYPVKTDIFEMTYEPVEEGH